MRNTLELTIIKFGLSLLLLGSFELTQARTPTPTQCKVLFNSATGFVPKSGLEYKAYSSLSGIIELPSVLETVLVDSQKKSKPIRLIFYPSNFGSLYEETPHNLGQTFLHETLSGLSSEVLQVGVSPKVKELVKYNLDDGRPLTEEKLFETQRGLFRTNSGEVRILETSKNIIVFAEFFGDYNYVGTYVIGLLKYLQITGEDLLVVHDDLKSSGVHAHFTGLNAKGNNGIRSILTSMTELVALKLQEEFNAFLVEQNSALSIDLSEVQAQLTAPLYQDPDYRYSNIDDFVSRTRGFFQNAFLQFPERSRKILMNSWIKKYQQMVTSVLTVHRLTLGTAASLESFLKHQPGLEQRDFVLTKAASASLLTFEERAQAQKILYDFIGFDLSAMGRSSSR